MRWRSLSGSGVDGIDGMELEKGCLEYLKRKWRCKCGVLSGGGESGDEEVTTLIERDEAID
jgi:hypothetical protein